MTSHDAAAAVDEVCRRAGIRSSVDPLQRRRASEDYAWLSPVLAERLPSEPAAVVVWPRSAEELATAVGAAHRVGLPVTPRGRGTGNYGQAVPLHGGVVVDCTSMDRIIDLRDGVASVEPGVTCAALERAARQQGQELSIFPSTVNSTMGGFLSGGAGGSGSIRHGFVWDGYVTGLEVMDCRDEPTVVTLTDGAVAPHLHTYGTTGLLTRAEVRLDEARAWTGLAASFADASSALAAGAEALGSDALGSEAAIRLLGVSDAPLVAVLPARPWLVHGRASLRAVVAVDGAEAFAGAVRRHGGIVEAVGDELVADVTAMSYNHMTLRAKRADPRICHLQVGGAALVDRADEVRAVLPDGRLHFDAMRGHDGAGFGGLLISRFISAAHLREGSEALRAMGVVVVDPHTWQVADPAGVAARAAERFDPDGLLNPGKLGRP